MSPLRIFFVDDNASERLMVPSDIHRFFDEKAIVITEEEVGMAIIGFRKLIADGVGLHAAILDYQLDRLTSRPLYRQMLDCAPEFARTRVALRTSMSEEHVRKRFAEDNLEFPPQYLEKGHLIDLIDWLKGLPRQEEGGAASA